MRHQNIFSFLIGLCMFSATLYAAGHNPKKPPGRAAAAVRSLGSIQCNEQDPTATVKNLAPTGCISPNTECRPIFSHGNPKSSCRIASTRPDCRDFTWEKCCFITCNQHEQNRLKFGNRDRCMNTCMMAPEARVFLPKAPK